MSRVKVISGKTILIGIGSLFVIGVMVWQGIAFSGNPDPTVKNINITGAILSCGVLVFREGLEAILVLSAITATVNRKHESNYGKGVAVGTGLGLCATLITWFIVVAILSDINLSELDIQAATGLIAIVVLLIVMNWFFHKVYWTGWITHHTKRGKRLLNSSENGTYKMFQGLVLLGFTAIYREGFEVVLFLQQLRLRDGSNIVLIGTLIGVLLTAIVAVFTFILHKHLPYKKMLVFTGVLLGLVLLVMVGESIQEMQQANWIPATPVGISLPSWLGMWFAVFPNIQGLIAQAAAVLIVIGSYIFAEYRRVPRHFH